MQYKYGMIEPRQKTTVLLIFGKHLLLFQQSFKPQCVLFHNCTYCLWKRTHRCLKACWNRNKCFQNIIPYLYFIY